VADKAVYTQADSQPKSAWTDPSSNKPGWFFSQRPALLWQQHHKQHINVGVAESGKPHFLITKMISSVFLAYSLWEIILPPRQISINEEKLPICLFLDQQ